MTTESPKKERTTTLLFRILADAQSLRWRFALIFILSLASANIGLLLPVPLSLAVDILLHQSEISSYLSNYFSPSQILALLAGSAGLIVLFETVLGYANWLLQLRAGEMLVLRFRSRLFKKLQQLSVQQHDRAGVSDLLYRLQNDVPPMQYLALQSLLPSLSSGVMFGALLTIVFRIDRTLVLVAICMIPLLWVAVRLHVKASTRGWMQFKRDETSGLTVLQEVLGNIRVVQAFQQEDREQKRFEAISKTALKQHLGAVGIETRMGILTAFVIAIGTAVTFAIGVRHTISGVLTIGQLFLVMAYLTRLFKPLEELSRNFSTMQSALSSARRVYEVIDDISEVPSALQPKKLNGSIETIRFENVTFGYRKAGDALKSCNFEIKQGMTIGISGRTGSGKTTLTHLLMRFLDPQTGAIYINGIDIRDLAIDELRDQFSVVHQEPVLFAASIAENIAYGRPDASPEEIQSAARLASAHDFISRLPEGYSTILTQRGMSLSGGERQRIAVARAYLKDAPILVLDEPTSGLDAQTETDLAKSFREFRKDRTVFVVSHRPALLADVDLHILVDAGVVTTAKSL